MTSEFTARVLSIVRRIPRGRVATYGEVAALAGYPRAARAVGTVMRTSHRPDVPYHRVIAAGGRLGGFGGNEGIKRALLAAEGVIVIGGRIRNLAEVRLVRNEPSRNEPPRDGPPRRTQGDARPRKAPAARRSRRRRRPV
jgi:O-6-methylguanine DNA methyltransferase